MSVTIGTIAGSTGLGSERQAIVTTSGDLWAFQYTGTNVLSSWVSQDGGATWTAGTTHTLAHAHNSEGRNLAVTYRQIGTTDVVHVGIAYKSGTSLGTQAIRGTISGTSLTWHTSETAIQSATPDSDSLFWSGSGLDFTASDSKVHFANGWAPTGNGDVNAADSTADAGSAEQMTPVSWSGTVIDSTVSNEARSFYIVDRGGGAVGLISDDGSAGGTCTGLSWYTGLPWNTTDPVNQKVTGAISAIDKNDWGAVQDAVNSVHVVYRTATGSFVHRRFDGSVWQAGQTIPSQTSTSGAGVALCSDGANVWLLVIDSDAANTVRVIRWSPASQNGIQDAWDASWQAIETSSQTRNFLGCARDVQNQIGLAYWSEGTNFVSVAFSAPPPVDPTGAFVQVAQGSSSASGATFGVAFTTQNITLGNVIVVCASIWHSPATTVTSVTDSAGNVYAKTKDAVESDGTHLSQWAAPITVGGGTKPTVTLHASGTTAEWALSILEYSGIKATAEGTNAFTTATAPSPITSGAASPVASVTGEMAVGNYGDGGNSIATIGVSAGWTQRGTSIQGASLTTELAVADQLTTAGVGPNASFTLSSTGSPGGVLVVVYQLAAAGTPNASRPFPRTVRGNPAVLRRELAFMSGQRLAYPAPSVASMPLAGSITSAAGFMASASLSEALGGAVASQGALSAALAEAAALQGAVASGGVFVGSLAEAIALAGGIRSAASYSGSVSLATALSGAILVPASFQATLAEAIALSAGLPIPASLSATLTLLSGTPISGRIVSSAAFGGNLTVSVALTGGAATQATLAASLGLGVHLAGPIAIVAGFGAILATVGGGVLVLSPPTLAKLLQTGRAEAGLLGHRSGTSTGGRSHTTGSAGRDQAKPQEGRDDVEPQ